MLQWRKCLFDWVADKHPLSAPSEEWWLFCVALQPLLVSVNITMVILQSRGMILLQQEKEIKVLVEKLTIKMEIGLEDMNLEYNEWMLQTTSSMGTGGLRPTMWSNTSMIKDCGRGI
jgi:hypothetical protein